MVSEIANNIMIARERIAGAAARAGRKPEDIALVAVSKTRTVEEMIEAARCGVDALGENRVQEALDKYEAWPGEHAVPWHMVGHLQRNKARKAWDVFRCIHSIDSVRLASALQSLSEEKGSAIRILVEVNAGEDPAKHGVKLREAESVMESIVSECPGLDIAGLMTVAPLDAAEGSARKTFAVLRETRDALEKKLGLSLPHLSMGMSGDFVDAILEGSTMVRIGTAIFGKRHMKGA